VTARADSCPVLQDAGFIPAGDGLIGGLVLEEALMTKVIVLVRRREDMSVDDFRAYLHGPHAQLVSRLPGLRRLVYNDVLPDPSGTDSPYDAIAENWFDSPEAMQAAFASPQGQAALGDVPNFQDPAQLRILVVQERDVLQAASPG
jgi:uncharacterized protein (TIGR02118 family)